MSLSSSFKVPFPYIDHCIQNVFTIHCHQLHPKSMISTEKWIFDKKIKLSCLHQRSHWRGRRVDSGPAENWTTRGSNPNFPEQEHPSKSLHGVCLKKEQLIVELCSKLGHVVDIIWLPCSMWDDVSISSMATSNAALLNVYNATILFSASIKKTSF